MRDLDADRQPPSCPGDVGGVVALEPHGRGRRRHRDDARDATVQLETNRRTLWWTLSSSGHGDAILAGPEARCELDCARAPRCPHETLSRGCPLAGIHLDDAVERPPVMTEPQDRRVVSAGTEPERDRQDERQDYYRGRAEDPRPSRGWRARSSGGQEARKHDGRERGRSRRHPRITGAHIGGDESPGIDPRVREELGQRSRSSDAAVKSPVRPDRGQERLA